jgi:hypothetical protein
MWLVAPIVTNRRISGAYPYSPLTSFSVASRHIFCLAIVGVSPRVAGQVIAGLSFSLLTFPRGVLVLELREFMVTVDVIEIPFLQYEIVIVLEEKRSPQGDKTLGKRKEVRPDP